MPRNFENAKQMSFDKYLEFEKTSEVRHEFVDGFVFAMAGGTDNHNSSKSTKTLTSATKNYDAATMLFDAAHCFKS
jgi:hypothetical protein